jgi:uncharacterized damage-inducible protein DinB
MARASVAGQCGSAKTRTSRPARVTAGPVCDDAAMSAAAGWIAPEVTRVEEPAGYDERSMFEAMLEWHRMTLLAKCAGLTGTELAGRPLGSSNLSLLGLVRHLADAERAWFRRHLLGMTIDEVYARADRPDAAFDEAQAAEAAADYERLVAEWASSRAAAAGRSLDDACADERFREWTLRWVYAHMIEEYARHNGHADLLREAIDGVTGE